MIGKSMFNLLYYIKSKIRLRLCHMMSAVIAEEKETEEGAPRGKTKGSGGLSYKKIKQ